MDPIILKNAYDRLERDFDQMVQCADERGLLSVHDIIEHIRSMLDQLEAAQ
jgi:hypothetical protein